MKPTDFPPVLLALTRTRVEGELLQHLVGGLAVSQTVALARVWLGPGRSRHLELAASAGNPKGGGTYGRLDGTHRVVRLDEGKIGQVATSGEPMVVRGLRGDEPWLANPDWIARQGVRTFVAHPLVDRGTLVGVLAVFARETVSDDVLAWLKLLADHAALCLGKVRNLQDLAAANIHLTVELARLRDGGAAADAEPPPLPTGRLVTRDELRAIERASIEEALRQTGGRIFGADGAAARLGMKPTTLASKIKTFGLKLPR